MRCTVTAHYHQFRFFWMLKDTSFTNCDFGRNPIMENSWKIALCCASADFPNTKITIVFRFHLQLSYHVQKALQWNKCIVFALFEHRIHAKRSAHHHHRVSHERTTEKPFCLIQNSCCQIKCSSFVWSAIVRFAGKFLLVVLFAYYLPLTVFKFTLRFSYTFCRFFLLSVMSSVMFMEFEPFWLRIFNILYAFLVTELSHSLEFQWKYTQKPTRTSVGKYFHTYSVPFGARSTWNSHRLFEC